MNKLSLNIMFAIVTVHHDEEKPIAISNKHSLDVKPKPYHKPKGRKFWQYHIEAWYQSADDELVQSKKDVLLWCRIGLKSYSEFGHQKSIWL